MNYFNNSFVNKIINLMCYVFMLHTAHSDAFGSQYINTHIVYCNTQFR